VFRILVVDDDPLSVDFLRQGLQKLPRPCEVYSAKDGKEALDFLQRRNAYSEAPAPHLILMDMNMPRMDGLETLKAIRSDPAVSVIPVIVLSTSAPPAELKRVYQGHANCFVQKPGTLEEFEEFVQALGMFWMNVAVLPQAADSNAHAQKDHKGTSVAIEGWEARSQAMYANSPAMSASSSAPVSRLVCVEQWRLMEDFATTVKELLGLHQQQFQAIIQCDPECNRFDLLIHMANEKKQEAKYAYMRHVESHGCSDLNVILDTSRT
jgi:CheY-like chemotaxis protein